ncbi:MAG: hypothetical protein PWR01_650 [Clostridiales bacterium]|nr:hypothetical protein [Clostridiales bacterium]
MPIKYKIIAPESIYGMMPAMVFGCLSWAAGVNAQNPVSRTNTGEFGCRSYKNFIAINNS